MTESRIQELVAQLEAPTALEREEAWNELKPLGEAVVPYLSKAYGQMKKRQGRIECVFHSIRYARTSDAAFQMGVVALNDRATLVRYRACGLLAYLLRADAVSHLSALLAHSDPATVADAKAAIDAIQHGNHHFFIDRTHSGRTFWEVNPGDRNHQTEISPSSESRPSHQKSWWQIWKRSN